MITLSTVIETGVLSTNRPENDKGYVFISGRSNRIAKYLLIDSLTILER